MCSVISKTRNKASICCVMDGAAVCLSELQASRDARAECRVFNNHDLTEGPRTLRRLNVKHVLRGRLARVVSVSLHFKMSPLFLRTKASQICSVIGRLHDPFLPLLCLLCRCRENQITQPAAIAVFINSSLSESAMRRWPKNTHKT